MKKSKDINVINEEAYTISETGKVHRDLNDLLNSDNAKKQIKELEKLVKNLKKYN